MYLKVLEMQGFKSFPDKTVMEFGKGMTSVVGPNGSGKSNIADAIRWVLGEQSTKSLRGSKMEDVVFSGTEKRRAQGFAEVVLKLDNKDRGLEYDKDEITVSRRYYRSGESEYRLNGENVRLRDVHELFMDTGLGRDGYSMVSQGKIEDMVSSKSTDRREMFEEAAGISHYRYRRADALRRLEQADENLIRLHDILIELESRVGPLESQSKKAMEFLVLAGEKKELEIGLWLKTFETSSQLLQEHSQKASIVEAQHKAVAEELDNLFEKNEDTVQKTRDITVKIEEIQKNSSSLEEQAAAFEAIAAVDRNSIEHNDEAIIRIERDKNQEDYTQKHIDEQIEEANNIISELNNKVAKKRKNLEENTIELSDVKSQDASFSKEYSGFSQKLNDVLSTLSEQQIIKSSAMSSLEEISGRLTVVDRAIEDKRNEVDKHSTAQKEVKTFLNKCEERVSELTNAVSGYTLRFKSAQEKAEKAKDEKDNCQILLNQQLSRVHMLKEMEKNMEGYSGSVKKVMQQSKNGMLRGIHGALSQLIGVKTDYAIAIETALGAAVQNIVTENEDNAKNAMKFLKENNSGRATFLPLTAIKGRSLNETGLNKCEGFIDVASSLVTFDKKYSEIIQAQLGRTVVVEDIDSAILIAKKYSYRFKIVTIDGQVINAGGSMTGGSKIQSAGFLSRGSEIDRLGQESKKTETKLSQLIALHKADVEALAAENAALEGTKADLAKAQEEKIRTESNLALLVTRYETASASLTELEKEKQASKERIDSLTYTLNQAKLDIEKQSSIKDELEQQLRNISTDRDSLLAKQKEYDELNSTIQMEIVSVLKDIEAQNESVERLKRRKQSHEGRIEELNGEIEKIQDRNKELQDKISKTLSDAAVLRDKAEQARQHITTLITERESHEKEASGLRLIERQKTDEREKLSSEMVRLEERKLSLMKELEEIEKKLFDEHQLTRREATRLEIVIESTSKANKRLSELKGRIKALGAINVSAIEEFKEVSERYEFMKSQIEDIEKSRDELKRLITELTSKMADRFKEQFLLINASFGETFRHLFDGGNAELILEDPEDILECGIEIKAQPPGKNVKSLSLLSGGEKGLCAIALLFAMLKVTPAPFCVFDEVEAALDDVNVTRYAQYVRSMTKHTQFILITHRRGTMEESDILYGVTMQEEGVSKMLELKTAEMVKKLGLE